MTMHNELSNYKSFHGPYNAHNAMIMF